MAVSESLIALLKEQLAPLGRISTRRMFSGAGLYCDGVIFGLILRDTLHFKVDDGNRAAYETEGMAPFSYQVRGRTVQMGAYWRVPERLLDEPDEMLAWARTALAAGRRAAAPNQSKRPRKGRRGA
jgi:DNA transformation protein